MEPPKHGKLQRYHTESFIIGLRDELTSATGTPPRTPERSDNPFEPSDLPGAMSRLWLSPGLFEDEPEGSSAGSFKWSIEHMATLHPVDIDHHDIIRTEYLKHVLTESDEDDAQENIRRFFERMDVHPLTSEPASASDFSSLIDTGQAYRCKRTSDVATKDASNQTDITMPPSFDFEKFFADYQTATNFRRVSLGGVRRRLFEDLEQPPHDVDQRSSSAAKASTGFAFISEASARHPSSGFAEDSNSHDIEMEELDRITDRCAPCNF
ncbi:hypothetical protein BV898_17700 [Hypsibius exemplaris]|uniref:Protein aurora borealis n=1 Tax=Hypsibius exemplaris TaxID=2072580 RepID=A0A9X6NG07_HYPEX|nr:hypothetical protein BV898_17700 [Hypsibius exemplaris]